MFSGKKFPFSLLIVQLCKLVAHSGAYLFLLTLIWFFLGDQWLTTVEAVAEVARAVCPTGGAKQPWLAFGKQRRRFLWHWRNVYHLIFLDLFMLAQDLERLFAYSLQLETGTLQDLSCDALAFTYET